MEDFKDFTKEIQREIGARSTPRNPFEYFENFTTEMQREIGARSAPRKIRMLQKEFKEGLIEIGARSAPRRINYSLIIYYRIN